LPSLFRISVALLAAAVVGLYVAAHAFLMAMGLPTREASLLTLRQ
jgi:type IV secretion system protein VirD4